jgi:hypothetical protein
MSFFFLGLSFFFVLFIIISIVFFAFGFWWGYSNLIPDGLAGE